MTSLGLGLGWRPQLAPLVLHRADIGFVEVLAESFSERQPLPLPLTEARRRGIAIIPHGVSLGLGGADVPDAGRLDHLARLALRVGAPLVSEHIAFVRADGREAGHLLPIPRWRAALDVLVENVRIASAALPVPLALEPVASLFDWPDPELDESEFLTELIERTGALLLLDVANVYANGRNQGHDPTALIERLPLDRIAYVHVAGGSESDGIYHDTHLDPVPSPVLQLLHTLTSRSAIPGVMLERDGRFPPLSELGAELDGIASAVRQSPWASLPNPRPAASQPARFGQREALATHQASLLGALLGQEPPPDGFDSRRIRAAADALQTKRHRIGLPKPVPDQPRSSVTASFEKLATSPP